MEEVRNLADGFVSPLQSGRKEPREAQDDPPDGRCHSEVVHEKEHDGARALAGRRVFDDGAIACYLLVSDEVPGQVAHRHHEIAS